MSESRTKKPQRTLTRVTHLVTGRTITSDDLLAFDADRYQAIRREATAARREGQAVFVCEMCGHPVYAPLEPRTRLPFWKHRKGSPQTCPWWTGDPGTVDQHSASQFQGAQESPLHHWLKYRVGEVLESDPKTVPGTVLIDEYLRTESGRRRPDVRAEYGGRKLAFEIQLSSTQLPIIDSREHFYQQEGFNLIWLTWKFEPTPRRLMLQAFVDIFYSHNKNLFSLDEEVLALANIEDLFLLRAWWEEGRDWNSKIVRIDELAWLPSGLAYAVAPWHVDFLTRWEASIEDGRMPSEARHELLTEIANKLGLADDTWRTLDDLQVGPLINLLLSLKTARPIGTKQANIVEMLNTFFHLHERWPYQRLVERIARVSGHDFSLAKPSVAAKLKTASRTRQAGQSSVPGRIALALFPDLLLQADPA